MHATQINAQQANVAIGGGQQIVNNVALQQLTQILSLGEDELPDFIQQQKAQLAAYSAVLTHIDQQE